MANQDKIRISNARFSEFFGNNPDFDILAHDFFDSGAREEIKGSGRNVDRDLDALRPYQRLLRLFPHETLAARRDGDEVETGVEALLSRGLQSAHDIAAVSSHRFVREHADALNHDEDLAREIHRRAVQIKAAARHAFANVRDLVASPYSRSSLVKYAEPELTDYFEGFPSYQSLFGSLDYIEVPHCASIFSPAAYFLDIMRITDEYITYYNEQTIPAGYRLDQRRPDLFDQIRLTCAETETTLPYVSLINEIFVARLAHELGQDPYEVVATAAYPFNLPFNRPLIEIDAYLDKLGTSLATAGKAMLAPAPDALGFGTIALARAALSLSAEQVEELTTVNSTDAAIGAQYGLASISEALPASGPGDITYAAEGTSAAGAGGQLGTLLKVGQEFESQGQIRTVVKIIDDASVQVDVPWVDSGSNVAWSAFGFPTDLTRDSSFRARVGDMAYQDLEFLLVQGLSTSELAANAADRFFINNTDEQLPPMAVVAGDAAKGNVYSRIENLSRKRLDRLSRFIRLARLTGIDYETLDWLMRICGAAEITEDFLIALAEIRQLSAETELDLGFVAPLVGAFKTSGRGDGPTPSDPFDTTFNDPALLAGRDPYASTEPIPFDPARPLAWAPGGLTGSGLSGTLQSATATTAVLSSAASSTDEAYAGLQLVIADGPGAGQVRIIESYDGATRTATLYAAWTTTPDAQSDYEITEATGLTDRLAAALLVKKTELPTLGSYYQLGNAPSSSTLSLDLETLTGLWRLGKIAWTYRLPVAEYFVARELAGLTAGYAANATVALADAQTAVATIQWLRAQDMSAYELAYVIDGTRSRYVRPPFEPEDVPTILSDLASGSVATHLTADSLVQTGFSEPQAEAIIAGLVDKTIIDAQGLVIPNDALFAEVSANFPVTVSELQSAGGLSAAEAAAVIDELTVQHPAYLAAEAVASTWRLTASYVPGTSLGYLFVGDASAANKRAFMSSYLDAIAAKTQFDILSPLFPIVANTAFQSQDIGEAQSQAVFSTLEATTPPVILPTATAEIGALSAGYDGATTGWGLFESPAAGQDSVISNYDPASKTATVSPDWTTVPDAFTYYQIVQPQQAGTAQAGGAETVTLDASASATDNAYAGFFVVLTGGTGADQRRLITAYDGTSKVATVAEDWTQAPDNTSTYQVESVVLAGDADGGTSSTIVLGARGSNQTDVYDGLTIRLLADPDAAGKTAEVQATLDTIQSQIILLVQKLDATAAAQKAAVMGGIASVLTVSTTAALAGLPYASALTEPRLLVPVFLDGDTATNQDAATAVLEGLSRFGLLRSKISFADSTWTAIARRPDLYDIAATDTLTYADLIRLGAFKRLTRDLGTDPDGLVGYLEMWPDVVGLDERLTALYELTGWPPGQISQLDQFLAVNVASYAGLERLDGLLRLAPPFALIGKTAADVSYLMTLADVVRTPVLGTIGATVDTRLWTALDDAAAASLSVVAARYADQNFAEVADQLRRAVDTEKRDALMGYLIWQLNKTFPVIKEPSDLFQYLLIDVETSGCDTTSPIAQAINSVQLYMQRCRMALEPGVTVDHIEPVWWTWMSAYRLWEANRKIFLYPENYLVPSQRASASPEFKQLSDELLQARPTEQNVAKAMVKYFDAFETLASLMTVGGYKSEQKELEGNQIDETAIFVGRTNTSPYQYYTREFTRSTLAGAKGGPPTQLTEWSAWEKVDVAIDADYVTPVWAFDRLFIFWNEITPSKSSTISTTSSTASSTQSTWEATLRYTFETSTGDWLAAQDLGDAAPIRIAPNDYAPANNQNVTAAFLNTQHYWHQPFLQAIPRGLPGTGTLSFSAGGRVARGAQTRLDKQISPGDFIYTAGQRLQVESVDAAAQELTTKTEFVLAATDTQFNVIPKDPKRDRYPPYEGPGAIVIVAGTNIVDGTQTTFATDFSPGDFIQVGPETRTIAAIFSDTQLVVTRNWTISTYADGAGTVTIFPNLTNVAGNGSKFLDQAQPQDFIHVDGQKRTIVDVIDDATLLISQPFDITSTKTEPYGLGVPGAYTVIPRANGSERLIAFYGPNLEIDTNYGAKPANPPHEANPGDDPFIAAKNDFNTGIYNSLNLIDVVKNDSSLPQHGDVTGKSALTLNGALEQNNVRFYAPTYDSSALATSSPIRSAVDRENNVLYAGVTERPMVALYWGNSAPGTTANQSLAGAEDRTLMYHINAENAALLGIGNQIGWYVFNNNKDSFFVSLDNPMPVEVGPGTVLRTFWQPTSSDDLQMTFGPYTLADIGFDQAKFQVTRLTTDVAQALKQRLFVGLDTLLSLGSQFLPESPFDQYYQTPEGSPPPTLDADNLPSPIMDFRGAYGLYFWEIFFHAPLMVAEWVKSNQDYATAKKWFEYIFNPTATDDHLAATGNDRYWQFRPFRENMTVPSLQEILTNTFEINKYNNDPFDPHAIARLRISAYAKTTVLKYIDNLIKWADALFTQDTRESITQATNLYVLARDLLGQKPDVVGVFEQPAAYTFNEIKAQYPQGGIPQFLIDLENTPLVPATGQGVRYADVPVNDIHAYFGVPDNAELATYWETIDDRLYKIRHCMNINGVVRQLALFAPPIDPRALIAGIGAGGSLTGGAGYGPYPIPNYRFGYLISVAKSLAGQVSQFGGALLAALDRKDGEALATLRLTQEAQLLQLSTDIKEMAIDQIDKQIESLNEALNGAEARKQHYKKLIEDDMLVEEIFQLTLMGIGAGFSTAASVVGAAAQVASAFPQLGSPFALTYGGEQLGASLQNGAGWLQALATVSDTTANILGIVASHKRRVEDWNLQETLAEFDVAQFGAQIAATEVQKQIAQRELQIHTAQIDQNTALQDFYKDKFTNQALYSWLAGRLATTHFQAYSLALEFARMAQRAYQFEYRTNSAFIAPSYWDEAHKGLAAGEGLTQALSQLEGAYIRNAYRIQNITKIVSLRQHDPVTFLNFMRTGVAEFDLPERIFDEEFPGQYKRRIKSLKVSIPALVGPYQNIHATLTQTANRVILQPDLNAVKFLLGDDVEVAEGVIEHNARAYQRISLSQGQGDTGVFDPDPNDPLYLPFEQTGAVSSWRLSMPMTTNAIDFDAISDVILELRYTALDGGDAFSAKVAGLPQLRRREWTQLIQPALQYQADWYQFMSGPLNGDLQTLAFQAVNLIEPNIAKAELLGFFVRLNVPDGTALGSQNAYLTVTVGGADPVSVLPAPDGSALVLFERPERLPALAADVAIGFDMRAGYTPGDLRDDSGKRLDPNVLTDVDTVLFMSGQY